MTQHLNNRDAGIIWLLHWTGWTQQQIAAAFGVNQGRINEVLHAVKFPEAEAYARAANKYLYNPK